MTSVLQLTKVLSSRPEEADCRPCEIRHYQGVDDVGPWLSLRQAAFARQRFGVREWSEADFEAEFLARWWWRPERMWLADAPGPESRTRVTPDAQCRRLIGAVTLAFRGTGDDARPVVHWLLVHPTWRRRGVGRALISRLEVCAWDLGYRQIWLETHAQWREAAALYTALGYVPAS